VDTGASWLPTANQASSADRGRWLAVGMPGPADPRSDVSGSGLALATAVALKKRLLVFVLDGVPGVQTELALQRFSHVITLVQRPCPWTIFAGPTPDYLGGRCRIEGPRRAHDRRRRRNRATGRGTAGLPKGTWSTGRSAAPRGVGCSPAVVIGTWWPLLAPAVRRSEPSSGSSVSGRILVGPVPPCSVHAGRQPLEHRPRIAGCDEDGRDAPKLWVPPRRSTAPTTRAPEKSAVIRRLGTWREGLDHDDMLTQVLEGDRCLAWHRWWSGPGRRSLAVTG
jgi:hypothetical protein